MRRKPKSALRAFAFAAALFAGHAASRAVDRRALRRRGGTERLPGGRIRVVTDFTLSG